MANLEDQPPLNTSIIGVRPDGTVWAYQPNAPDGSGMVELGGPAPPPGTDVTLTLGAPDQVSGGYQLDEGWYFLVNEGDPAQAQVFYTDGVTETVPTGGWQAYPVTITVV
jgi:hypothetical protein